MNVGSRSNERNVRHESSKRAWLAAGIPFDALEPIVGPKMGQEKDPKLREIRMGGGIG